MARAPRAHPKAGYTTATDSLRHERRSAIYSGVDRGVHTRTVRPLRRREARAAASRLKTSAMCKQQHSASHVKYDATETGRKHLRGSKHTVCVSVGRASRRTADHTHDGRHRSPIRSTSREADEMSWPRRSGPSGQVPSEAPGQSDGAGDVLDDRRGIHQGRRVCFRPRCRRAAQLRAHTVTRAEVTDPLQQRPNARVKPPPREAQREGGSPCSAVGLNA